MAVGRDRFYFPPPSTSTDYDSMVDKVEGISEGIASAEETRQIRDSVGKLQEGQEALNNRTDLLSPLLDYGSAYASTANGITNTGQFSYSNQIGPMQACHIANGRLILEEKGLWNLSARIYIDYTVSPIGLDVAWEVRVLAPDGSIFSTTEDVYTGGSAQTREINTSVVVPDAGYQVQVYVRTLLVGRWIRGGDHRSRLTVQHISRSTESPI
ncbi:hypothetical protein [Gordonia sp. QH-12]|uniref:hypothetical protein n=1 Tax=Gordonia sp. QH-12 TaxID=1437876 RepID=UPI0007853DD9|nr:hypothetical protein [Gordonia sp. QH-12]